MHIILNVISALVNTVNPSGVVTRLYSQQFQDIIHYTTSPYEFIIITTCIIKLIVSCLYD